MSSLSAERLYALLPALHRTRDAEQGRPLQALVALIARELQALEEDVEQLYDDQFIETCQPWVAPYIGDLIGYRPLRGEDPAVAAPRAEVADTIALRRRKGTAAMLEQLARDVTGRPARAVEFFTQLATTQYMKHLRLQAPATADLRAGAALRRLGGPFNATAHTAEVRRPERGAGRYNIPNIGIFLWRLQPFALSAVALTPDAGDPLRRFRCDPLGADRQLFRLPADAARITRLATPADVPDPLAVRLIEPAVAASGGDPAVIGDYGPGGSLVLWRPGATPGADPTPVPASAVCFCDLRDVPGGWAHAATQDPGTIAIDPHLGRVRLGADLAGPLLATFHTGFSRAIGGGEYERSPSLAASGGERRAAAGEPLQPHLDALAAGGRLLITDSSTFAQTPVLSVAAVTAPGAAGIEVVVAARDGARPLIAAGGPLLLRIGARGRLVLDGLVIGGAGLQVEVAAGDDEPRELVLRHCTLVPGLGLLPDGTATAPGAPSLTVPHPFTRVTLEACISGPLRVVQDTSVAVSDSIIDAGSAQGSAYEGVVAGGPGAELTISDSTVVGKLHARLLRLATDTIFHAQLAGGDAWPAPLLAARRQEGCVRYCCVPPGALLPRNFRCLPDAEHPDALPRFTSLRYADPGYAQLLDATSAALRAGASDGGEIGVLHPLRLPQREANLRIRLDEYLRFGLHAGLFHVT